jgi:diamine N-acetyltransferase
MFSIVDATEQDIPSIQTIAEKTWWQTYSSLLSKEQLEYMLATIYGNDPLRKVISEKSQTFILIKNESGSQGFAAYGIKNASLSIYKLHKIYVLPENHGKGFGKILVDEVVRRVSLDGGQTLDLNVNRFNKAKHFYEKLGFKVIGEEDVPIGPYFMNDFVMRLEINATTLKA